MAKRVLESNRMLVDLGHGILEDASWIYTFPGHEYFLRCRCVEGRSKMYAHNSADAVDTLQSHLT